MIIQQVIKTWIEKVLSDLSYINWDRFVKFSDEKYIYLRVFGWIDRQKDSYKDFVVIEFSWDDTTRTAWLVATSSKEFSKKIDCYLAGDNNNHSDCERVEHNFKILNSIKLKSE